MSDTMIPVNPDVLQGLLSTRRNGGESWSELIHRLLPMPAGGGTLLHSPMPFPARPSSVGKIDYEILGEKRSAASAINMLVDVLRTLGELDSSFLGRLEPLVRGRSRNHIARRPELVYPERPDLAESARTIMPGWYVGANIADREKLGVLKNACKAAGLLFGVDLKVSLKGVGKDQ